MEEKVPMKSVLRLHMKRIIPLVILLIILIFILIVFFTFRIQKVIVTGSSYYTEEEIKEKIIDSSVLNNSLLLYIKFKFAKPRDIPFIQDIDMELTGTHTVNLQVYEKKRIGCVEYMNEYAYFDKDGKVLEITKEKRKDVPSIAGVTFSQMSLYETLTVVDENEDIFTIILNLSQLIQKYDIPIEKVIFDINDSVTLVTGDIEVLLGKREVYDEQIAELSGILPESKGLKGELDLTNFKEGQDNIFKVE